MAEADEDWTAGENDLIVADYFAMLIEELAGRSYNKSEHRRSLRLLMPHRSESSIEFKHQNISAVVRGLGEPWIRGYMPAIRFQGALVDAVIRWLDANPGWSLREPTSGSSRAASPRVADGAEAILWIGPPPTQSNEAPPKEAAFMARLAQKYDVAGRDERNKKLGRAGEERVFRHEVANLKSEGRDDLARKVHWTADEDGDGAGYDIASFEADGRERLIEVKTTNGWERTPFHISRNELAAADAYRDRWCLVRLWNFACKPRAYELRPPLDAHVALTPTSFLATPH